MLSSRRCVRSTYACQMAHPRERSDSQAFRDSGRLSPPSSRSLYLVPVVLVVRVVIVFVDSIWTARRNARNAGTVVLRERFPECAYGLIYGILRLLPEIFVGVFCMDARDYGNAIAANRIRYVVISHSVSSGADPPLAPMRSAIFRGKLGAVGALIAFTQFGPAPI